jgi:hypothetical protein
MGRLRGKDSGKALWVTLGVAMLAGCADFSQSIGMDPLLGGPPMRPASVASGAPSPSAPGPVSVLPLPSSNGTLSTATLAAGTPRPLDTNQDLRIGAPTASAGADGWARQGASENRGMAESSGATLQAPQPIGEPPPKRDLLTVSNPGPGRDSSAGAGALEQALKELEARGALYQQLVGANGEWKFRCSIPNRQNPQIQRTYEFKDRDPVAAIRAVLNELDKGQ